jgi:hypothetical protein
VLKRCGRPLPAMVAAVLAALVALICAGSASAGPPGKWTQVTGVAGQADLNTLRVGLARTADGVLHVGWARSGPGTVGQVLHSSISANAKTVAGPDTIFTYPGGVNQSVELVRAPEGIRAFFAGLAEGSGFDRAMATTVSTSGAAWMPPQPASRAGNSAKPVYAAGGLGASVGLDGTLYSAWGDSAPDGGGFHVGLDASVADGELPGGLQQDPGIGVDSASGQVFLAWNDLDTQTVKVTRLSPPGAPVTLPNSAAAQLQHEVGITGRIGAAGVFIAFTQGTNAFLGKPALFRVDTGKAIRLSSSAGEKASIAAAPSGRLWVFWKKAGTVFARRSNRAATKFGATRRIRVPGGNTTTIFSLAGEATRGPLDLLALVDPPTGGIANFHQRILPGLTLKPALKRNGKATFKVTDAGEPIAGAKVKVSGEGTKTTGAKGTVRFTLPEGRHTATATKNGYAAGKATVRVN